MIPAKTLKHILASYMCNVTGNLREHPDLNTDPFCEHTVPAFDEPYQGQHIANILSLDDAYLRSLSRDVVKSLIVHGVNMFVDDAILSRLSVLIRDAADCDEEYNDIDFNKTVTTPQEINFGDEYFDDICKKVSFLKLYPSKETMHVSMIDALLRMKGRFIPNSKEVAESIEDSEWFKQAAKLLFEPSH